MSCVFGWRSYHPHSVMRELTQDSQGTLEFFNLSNTGNDIMREPADGCVPWIVYMITPGENEVSQLLIDWRDGDKAAFDKLVGLVHHELRRIARRYMRRERAGHTLESAALVNEAYLRLVEASGIDWQNRAHFFAIAAQLMRRILVDHARSRKYAKRGGAQQMLALSEADQFANKPDIDLVALDDALKALATISEQQCRLVELRFFGGLTIEEAAEVLGVSHTTVEKDWALSRAWLRREMQR